MRLASAVLVVAALAPRLVGAQEAGVVSGRVTDSASGLPVVDLIVRIEDVGSVLTDDNGLFRLADVPAGSNELVFEHLTYGRHTRSVTVIPGQETVVAVEIAAEAIELTPLTVEALSEIEQRRRISGNSINEIRAEEIEAAAKTGMNLGDLIQTALPGVDVRPGPAGMCVTYRAIRTGNNRGDCDGLAVRVDGVPAGDPRYVYTTIPLRDIQRIEVLSPGQAGVRYGMRSGQGVLLIETKRADEMRPNDLSRYLSGFGWEGETRPYPWPKVIGASVLTNAATVGVSLLFADRCFWTPEANPLALRTQCGPLGTTGTSVASVAIPAVAGVLATRWAGTTDRSRGRAVPAMVGSAMMLTGGYLMLLSGEGEIRTGGAIVLLVAVPATEVILDRALRILR